MIQRGSLLIVWTQILLSPVVCEKGAEQDEGNIPTDCPTSSWFRSHIFVIPRSGPEEWITPTFFYFSCTKYSKWTVEVGWSGVFFSGDKVIIVWIPLSWTFAVIRRTPLFTMAKQSLPLPKAVLHLWWVWRNARCPLMMWTELIQKGHQQSFDNRTTVFRVLVGPCNLNNRIPVQLRNNIPSHKERWIW